MLGHPNGKPQYIPMHGQTFTPQQMQHPTNVVPTPQYVQHPQPGFAHQPQGQTGPGYQPITLTTDKAFVVNTDPNGNPQYIPMHGQTLIPQQMQHPTNVVPTPQYVQHPQPGFAHQPQGQTGPGYQPITLTTEKAFVVNTGQPLLHVNQPATVSFANGTTVPSAAPASSVIPGISPVYENSYGNQQYQPIQEQQYALQKHNLVNAVPTPQYVLPQSSINQPQVQSGAQYQPISLKIDKSLIVNTGGSMLHVDQPSTMSYSNVTTVTPPANPANPPKNKSTFEWISITVDNAASLSDKAVVAGYEGKNFSPLWVIRAKFNRGLLPGKFDPNQNAAYVAWYGKAHPVENIEVLCADPEKIQWVQSHCGVAVPSNAIVGGQSMTGELLYIGRAKQNEYLVPGKVHQSHKALYIPYGGKEVTHRLYDVLCTI